MLALEGVGLWVSDYDSSHSNLSFSKYLADVVYLFDQPKKFVIQVIAEKICLIGFAIVVQLPKIIITSANLVGSVIIQYC